MSIALHFLWLLFLNLADIFHEILFSNAILVVFQYNPGKIEWKKF